LAFNYGSAGKSGQIEEEGLAGEKKLLIKFLYLINNNYREKDLEELIIALVELLLPTIKREAGPYLRMASYQPRDIALITISSLFIRDSKGRFPVLEKLFNWKITEKFLIAEERDFQRYLKKILSRRLKQTFYYLSSEIRPERARIRKEILYSLKKNPGFRINKKNHLTLVSFCPDGDLSQRPEGSAENEYSNLLYLCLNGCLGGLQVPRFLKRLAAILREKQIALEISLSILVDLYVETQKNYLISGLRSLPLVGQQETDWSVSFYENFQKWQSELQEKNALLLNKYIRKNKMTVSEKENYLKALNDLILDWYDGGQEKPLLDYLKKYQPDLQSEDYRKEKRKIFEYLVKNSKNFFKNKLQAEA